MVPKANLFFSPYSLCKRHVRRNLVTKIWRHKIDWNRGPVYWLFCTFILFSFFCIPVSWADIDCTFAFLWSLNIMRNQFFCTIRICEVWISPWCPCAPKFPWTKQSPGKMAPLPFPVDGARGVAGTASGSLCLGRNGISLQSPIGSKHCWLMGVQSHEQTKAIYHAYFRGGGGVLVFFFVLFCFFFLL